MKTDNNETGNFCPLIKETCIERKCKFYVKLIGTNPQTDTPIDHWDCAIAWAPILMIENTKKANETGAAIESLRNEMTKGQSAFNNILQDASNKIHGLSKHG